VSAAERTGTGTKKGKGSGASEGYDRMNRCNAAKEKGKNCTKEWKTETGARSVRKIGERGKGGKREGGETQGHEQGGERGASATEESKNHDGVPTGGPASCVERAERGKKCETGRKGSVGNKEGLMQRKVETGRRQKKQPAGKGNSPGDRGSWEALRR